VYVVLARISCGLNANGCQPSWELVLVLPNLISLARMMIKQDGAQKLGQ